jgi:hypothetical protein
MPAIQNQCFCEASALLEHPDISKKKHHLRLNFSHKQHLQLKISLAANDKLPTMLVAIDRRFFFLEYEYGNFIHVFKDEFLRLHYTPICSHVVA